MEPEATTTTQHKRGSETSSYNLRPRGATAAHAVIAPAQTFAKSQKTDRTTKTVTSAVLEACREAFPYRPAASIACLTKNQTSIDLTLVEIIETVDSSKNKDGRSLLHEAVIRGHAATVQSLIAAGACTEAENDDGCMPCDLAIPNSTCRSILVHHASVYGEVFRSPSALINAVVAHCPSFSMPKENLPEMPLSLRACHLEPSFLWAPPAARNEVFSWAQDAFIAQLATTTPPFAELPDDCCGDVLDFLDLTMTREELINVTTHCSSPEAQAWEQLMWELWDAAKEGNVRIVQECLNKGADVHAQSWTALHIASSAGRTAVVKALLDAGADIESRDYEERTALITAMYECDGEVVRFLLEAGADVEAKDLYGSTAYTYTSTPSPLYYNAYLAIRRVLVAAGANED